MTEMIRPRLLGAGLGGLMLIATLAGCADQTEPTISADPEQGANDVQDDQPNPDRRKYTVVPGTGPAQVGREFDILVPYAENGEADVFITARPSSQDQSFFMAQGDVVEFTGWSFEAVYVSGTLVQFVVTTPDGKVFDG